MVGVYIYTRFNHPMVKVKAKRCIDPVMKFCRFNHPMVKVKGRKKAAERLGSNVSTTLW